MNTNIFREIIEEFIYGTNKFKGKYQFKFKDEFYNLLTHFNYTFYDLINEWCLDENIEWHKTIGKSGSIFIFSHNKKFIFKSISAKEHETFEKINEHYFDYMKKNKSLLAKILILTKVKISKMKTMYFIMMENIFTLNKKSLYIYDLKGRVPKKDINYIKGDVIRDNTLNHKFIIKKKNYDNLNEIIFSDVNFLNKNHLIDYSLVIFLIKKINDESVVVKIDDIEFNMNMGIIDYLSSYDDCKKKISYFFKSFIWKNESLSIINNNFYSRRFYNYFKKIFVIEND